MKKKRKLKPSPIIAGSDFYRSELSKRKLISSNPKNKMKQIFKKFEELDSYIDIEEIVKIYKKSLENESEDKDE